MYCLFYHDSTFFFSCKEFFSLSLFPYRPQPRIFFDFSSKRPALGRVFRTSFRPAARVYVPAAGFCSAHMVGGAPRGTGLSYFFCRLAVGLSYFFVPLRGRLAPRSRFLRFPRGRFACRFSGEPPRGFILPWRICVPRRRGSSARPASGAPVRFSYLSPRRAGLCSARRVFRRKTPRGGLRVSQRRCYPAAG